MAPQTNTQSTWGEGVKTLRIAQDMTQADLADRAGLSQPALSRIERGSRQISDATRLRIAKALGVNAHELFPYEDREAAAS